MAEPGVPVDGDQFEAVAQSVFVVPVQVYVVALTMETVTNSKASIKEKLNFKALVRCFSPGVKFWLFINSILNNRVEL